MKVVFLRIRLFFLFVCLFFFFFHIVWLNTGKAFVPGSSPPQSVFVLFVWYVFNIPFFCILSSNPEPGRQGTQFHTLFLFL